MTSTPDFPLRGRTIVLTRPATGSLGRRLTDLGARVEHIPLIAIGPPADGGVALRAALADIAMFDWLMVTSANGAAALGGHAVEHRRLRLAAVGAATAAALAAWAGRPVDYVPEQANSDGLLAGFPAPPARILLAQADLAGDHLASGLRDAGHDVVAVDAYATTPLPPDAHRLRVMRHADAVVLASGSAVEAWAGAAGAALAEVAAAVVTIGERTAHAAAGHGLPVAAVATAPTDAAVVDAVASVLAVR